MTDWWERDFQTTIDAYYEGELASGLEACERLLSVADVPSGIDLQTRRNLVFYTKPLGQLIPSMTTQQVDIPVAAGWSRFNPSIGEGPAGLRMIVRSANFTTTRQLRYTLNDAAGI